MKVKRVLITGGAGFIGSHLSEALLARGYAVRVLDALVPQVHGPDRRPPDYLSSQVELMVGDVGDPLLLKEALQDIEGVVHFAAAVGVGQSMYQIQSYVEANSQATADMLQVLSEKKHDVQKVVVASSMSIYGEGAYYCADCGPCPTVHRDVRQLDAGQWEMRCPVCHRIAGPILTSEEKALTPTSIYAITKRDQEEMCLCIGRAYKIPTVALRFFNVYGERQSLSNPYTGVAAIFSSCLLNDLPPLIYEDGQQTRDFTHVSDIVQATILALEKPQANYQVFNVGTGQPTTVLEVARVLAQSLGKDLNPQILSKSRIGDIRHCSADISKISKILGYEPKVSFIEGMRGLCDWIRTQPSWNGVQEANARLQERGLVS